MKRSRSKENLLTQDQCQDQCQDQDQGQRQDQDQDQDQGQCQYDYLKPTFTALAFPGVSDFFDEFDDESSSSNCSLIF